MSSSSADDLATILASPALLPPAGVTPNFDHPSNNNGLAWAVLTLCMVISTICFLMRAYARVVLAKKFGIEEVLVLCAYGCFWGQAYASYALIYAPGYFVHEYDLHYADLVRPSYLFLVFGVFYQIILPMLKIAILIEWTRLFVPAIKKTTSPFWWGCMAVILVQAVSAVIIVVLLNVQCTPHAKIWEFYLPGTCMTLNHIQLSSASVQLFSDVCMFLLPQGIIWGLRMSWEKRLGVSVIFGLGILACVSACFRVATTVSFGTAADQIYNFPPLLFWAVAEGTCGFFIVCVPCAPKIFQQMGVMRLIKRRLGVPTTGAANSKSGGGGPGAYKAEYGGGYPRKMSRSGLTSTAEAYYQIDEEAGLPMEDIKASESTERLHRDASRASAKTAAAVAGAHRNQITRTTQVVVTHDDRSARSDSIDPSAPTPWAS